MRRVIQKDGKGCGIACIAMVAEVTYESARRQMFGSNHVEPTLKDDIRKGLRKFGIRSATRLVYCRNYQKLPFDAILKTNLQRDKTWHWIVWDASRKNILDPMEKPYRWPRVVSYLRVYRTDHS